MAHLQKQFKEFHDEIKLSDENIGLINKREMFIKELKEGFKDELIPGTEKKLTFETFPQGSYAMGTGITHESNHYDIDVGVVFDINDTDIDPVELKKMVIDKLKRHNRIPDIRRSCVTINYENDGFHVDLAIYAKCSGNYKIAKGREFSSSENKFWEDAAPKDLIKYFKDLSTDEDHRKQFRRIVRYLKAWRDHKCSSCNPISIGLTIMARQAFLYNKDEDLTTLINVVSFIKSQFSQISDPDDDYKLKYTISCKLPVSPWKDVFEGMSLNKTDNFYYRVKDLLEALNATKDNDLADEASKILRKIFGDRFPLVVAVETAKSIQKPYSNSGRSA